MLIKRKTRMCRSATDPPEVHAWQSVTNRGALQESWDARIQRAEHLAAKSDATNELLKFYGRLLRVQRETYEYLRSRRGWLPSGYLREDLPVLRVMVPAVLGAVESGGPAALVEAAQFLLQADEAEIDQMLFEQWTRPSDLEFFAKAILQPYARWLAESGTRPRDRDFERRENLCPFCGGSPQLAILHVREDSSESSGRDLMCSTCLTVWSYRRVVCAKCGEERPAKLGYYHSPESEHVRIEACDTCRHYIKGIDLTRFGLAIPLVDEVATAALDLWARERGYTKIELNLIGL
jgi:formate dehydrogenase accessory protein FdhE